MGFPTAIVLLGVLGVTLVFAACPTGWKEYSGHCYKFSMEIEDWPNARFMCRTHHKSDLIAIETAAEQTWFKTQALTFNHTNQDDGFWLGATDWEVEGSWVWESLSNSPAVKYLPWGAGQPNNRNNSENCLAAMKYFDYIWSDEFCNWVRLQYVCEMPVTADAVVG